jgi:hypothetical protein
MMDHVFGDESMIALIPVMEAKIKRKINAKEETAYEDESDRRSIFRPLCFSEGDNVEDADGDKYGEARK